MTCPFGYGSAPMLRSADTPFRGIISEEKAFAGLDSLDSGSTAASMGKETIAGLPSPAFKVPGGNPRDVFKQQLLMEKNDISNGVRDLHYSDYLGLKTILDAQRPVSALHKDTQHDEMLFIITHQTYELWFKQILHELRSVHDVFHRPSVCPASLHTAVSRLQRVSVIQGLLSQQMSVLETMTPMAFHSFREYLETASGFQSAQFRQIEVILGMPIEKRRVGDEKFLMSGLLPEDQALLMEYRDENSLAVLIDRWLSRIPFFGNHGDEEPWPEQYRLAVMEMFNSDETLIRETVTNPNVLEAELRTLDTNRKNFDSLFNVQQYEEAVRRGTKKISHTSTMAVLFIFLYRDQPVLTLPYQFLQALISVDNGLTTWRLRHVAMAEKQVGLKMGTGGSSGVQYLHKSATENKAFRDIVNVASYIVPQFAVPPLSENMKKQLGLVAEKY